MRKNKLLLLLVLLMMAATGAMAQVAITTNLADSYDAKVGIPITLSIEANNAIGYQWYQVSSSEKEIIIEGATSSSYTFTPTEVGEYKFFCMAMGEANLYDLTKTTTVIAALPQTYSVTMAEGTEDAENWTVPAEAAEGSPVTATYNGTKKVKSVKAVKVASGTDLATITADYVAKDGETLTGTLASNVKISIADGATVTLDNVTINGVHTGDLENMWAGLTCLGDATIILKDGTENKITGFHNHFPAIYIPGDRHNPDNNKTLIIKGGEQGTGKLIARNNGRAAGIGGVQSATWLNQLTLSAGNIEIQGGDIEAYAGEYCAAIGAAASDTCGYIRISGGKILANGSSSGVGIGCGTGMNESSCEAHCGDITITGGNITAYGGGGAAIGSCKDGVCGNITISGGTVKATGNGWGCPGIGSGYKDMFATGCGDILINGGTVEASGGNSAPGIGSGGSGDQSGTCGTITITSGVTSVKATKGEGAPNSIGKGDGGQDITVNIEAGANVIMAPVTVTWNSPNFNSSPYTRDGVTLTAGNAAQGNNFYDWGEKTFTNTIGKFTKIEIVCGDYNLDGWAQQKVGEYHEPEGPSYDIFKLTWTGNAESVTIPGKYVYNIQSITFTIQ